MSPTELYGFLLAIGVLVVAFALTAWQWSALGDPGGPLSEEDASYFARQNVRRWAVALIMFLLSGLIFVGSRTGHRVNGRPNPLFIEVWLLASALVVALLVLALVDWLALRRYARRQRGVIVREGMEILRDEFRRRATLRDRTRGDGNL